eukprot:TRINITY_DN7952_c0_g1_i2.p2 TRINITY_DN7952_c0_g1~~TRINITY_DN7952_c0_g1_i2.p2  ORF type:complete len:246 (+),score=71.24 TRINITY_DN7952_c0_g1_i2:624-1361(+)
MQLIALITSVCPRQSSGCDLELSLLNSTIHNWEQKPLEHTPHEGRTFCRLGLQSVEPKFHLKNSSALDHFVALDGNVRTYNVLETLINELGISEFATLKYGEDKMVFQSNVNFDYTKLRDMQNMDWAEESIRYGEELKVQGKPPEEILKYYESAIDLDGLNATAHILKGDILMQINKIEEAMEAYKIAHRLDPENVSVSRKYEETLRLLMKIEQAKTKPIVLEERQAKLMLKNGKPNENYKMVFE